MQLKLQVVLKALRAAPETEEAVERNDETSAVWVELDISKHVWLQILATGPDVDLER